MQTLTAVLPNRRLLPPDLALLLAPVRADEAGAPGDYVGHADGVLLGDGGRLLAFIVRLAPDLDLDARGTRTLVPAKDVTVTEVMEGPILQLSWTEAQLRAQPRLDDDPQTGAGDRPDDPPPESQRRPSTAGVAPPGPGTNSGEAAKEGLEGAAMGAALGALAGLVLGGPIAAASLAVFFAVGGSLAGAISGAAQEPAPEAGTDLAPHAAEGEGPRRISLGSLEQRLREPGLEAEGFVTRMRLPPVTPAGAPPVHARGASGWR